MTDTPAPDYAARSLAEQIYSAYAQKADGPIHPQHEQTLVTRLAEALRPRIEEGESALVAAANAALEAFEQAEPGIRGPRVAQADPASGIVGLAAG